MKSILPLALFACLTACSMLDNGQEISAADTISADTTVAVDTLTVDSVTADTTSTDSIAG